VTSSRLTGFRAIDHIGLTVPDLDAAIRFFVDLLGAEEFFRHGPYGPSGEQSQRQFDRHPDSIVEGIAMVRLGPMNIELLQYSSPDQRTQGPGTSDAGGHHIAFYVDDLDDSAERLRSAGVEVLGDPMPLPGPESGPDGRFIFFRTPWGLFLELVTYPSGKDYEGTTDRRLFDPREEHA
jgi:catechol 2,3-dioxygenase-like lactoylglutathione lyase family enzyme